MFHVCTFQIDSIEDVNIQIKTIRRTIRQLKRFNQFFIHMENEFPNLIECRNFKYFNAESFLNDLYTLPWIEIDNKENVDKMWECWKSLFVQVLDKHAPLKTKRVRKRGSVSWINRDVRPKLFERDFLKRKAIKTNEQSDWNKYKSSRNSANIALRQAKREYYKTKFQNPKTNPKHA